MKINRKFLFSAIMSTVFIAGSAYAAEINFDVERKVDENKVIITGKAAENDIVSIQAMPSSVTPDMIHQNAGLGINTVFCRTDNTNADGSFLYTIELDTTDAYTIYMSSAKTDGVKSEPIQFTVGTEYSGIVAMLGADNDPAKDDKTEFIDEVEQNKAELGFNSELYSTVAVERFYNEYKNSISSTDMDLNTNNFNKCALIEKLNSNGSVNAAEWVKELYSADTQLMTFYGKHIKTDEAENYFTSKMKGQAISDSADLLKTAKEAMILTAAKYPDGNMNIKDIMNAYNSGILNLSSISSNAGVYTAIAAKNYVDIPAFLTAYKAAVGAGGGNSGGSGGGSGSGGGGGSGSGGGAGTNSDKYTNSSVGSIQISGAVGQTGASGLSIKFEDLDSVEWAYSDVAQLYEKGIVSGYTETEFMPNVSVVREQFVAMIVRASGLENTQANPSGFSDVVSGAWYENTINVAKQNGLINGIGDNNAGIGMEITRQDMAVMIYNAMLRRGYVPKGVANNFTDNADCADYANTAIAEMSALGIINGVGDNRFDPNGIATRAQAAVIINRALSYLE